MVDPPPPLCKAREETPEGMEKAFPKQAALSLTCIGKGSTTRRSSRVTDELKEIDSHDTHTWREIPLKTAFLCAINQRAVNI